MTRKNPTSPIRTGFDYQDCWALKLCGDWLVYPEKYQWIWLETSPSEDSQGGFYLDDIILLNKKNSYHLFQIKHKQNPKIDKWSWNDLIRRNTGKRKKLKDSLIQKWFKSFFKHDLRDKIEDAVFVTNGLPEEDLKQYIVDEIIDIQKVREENSDIYDEIRHQLGDEIDIEDFFNCFRFSFGNSDQNVFETQTRDYFYKEIRATESGVTNLLWQIHKEAGRPKTAPIILDQIKQWCEFDRPLHLNEQFEIPEDFEFFNGIEHNIVFKDLLKPTGGIKVFYGKPGTGKSTYLSKLHHLLRKKKTISIRHHYHISPNEPDPVLRLKTYRVTEAIKAQFKEHSEEIGELSHKNSANIHLSEYVSKLAEYAKLNDTSFVLIIDGLDHPLRQGHEDELKSLLSDICHPQQGLWLVFGMQEIAKKYLPQIVYDLLPEDQWIEVKGLSPEAVDRIFHRNLSGLKLPDHANSVHELSDKLYSSSKGNPLHLRYSLQQLKNQLKDSVLTEYSFRFLLPYDDDIIGYYKALWRSLPGNSKTIAIIISCVEFQFIKEQLLDLISTFISNPAEITESYLSISHLLYENKFKVSVYHNSFRLFLCDQKEFEEQEIPVKRIIRSWLESSGYENLKWAELRKLSYYLGDPEPILQLDRVWLVDSIASLREPYLINSQLNLAREAAFKSGRFGKVLELSTLDSYFENGQSFSEDAWSKIWDVAYRASGRNYADFNLDDLTAKQLALIVREAANQGDFSKIPEAIDKINYLHKSVRIQNKGEIGSELPHLMINTINIVSLDRKHDHQRMFQYVTRFRESRWSEDLFPFYAEVLLKTRQFEKMNDFLKSDFSDNELPEILKKCCEYDNLSRENRFIKVISSQSHNTLNYCCLAYLIFREMEIDHLPPLPQYDVFPTKVPEYESAKRVERSKIFSENFILGLIYGLQDKGHELIEWIQGADDRWTLNIMSNLFRSAIDISGQIKETNQISIRNIFEGLAFVTPLEWPENRELYELQLCLATSISSILKFLLNGKSFFEEKVHINDEDVSIILKSDYYSRHDFLQSLLAHNRLLLTKAAYENFMSQESDIWQKHLSGFPERSEHYADLTKLAIIHSDNDRVDIFLRCAADNFLGYGYHKDLFLDSVLESIEACHRAGSERGIEWIKRLAKVIEYVTEFTDGDETNYIPKHLAEILGGIDPSELNKYYYQNAKDEKLYLAEDNFSWVIKSLKFDQNIDTALGSTALDGGSLGALREMASQNPNALESLSNIEDYFGDIEFKKDTYQSSVPPTKKEPSEYSSVCPEQLKEHLSSLKTRYDRGQYLAEWLRSWLSTDNADKQEIYKTCIAIIEENGLHNSEGKILDVVYPLACQFDNERAFDLLCWAQANYGGWDRHFTDSSKAIKRFMFVADNYEDRYMEFFEKSIFYSGKQYGRGGNYFIPIPRGIEFLALFKNLKIMEEIAESAVSVIESLMAELLLPEAKWLSSRVVDQFDILVQRLTWPSPLVRESAACAIADLLNYDNEKEKLFERYLEWLKESKVESIIAVALLPIIKALEKNDGLIVYVEPQNLLASIPFTSIVIEKLVLAISHRIGQEMNVVPHSISALTPPDEYVPHKFFVKHITGFLAPVYSDNSEEISTNAHLDFMKYWAYNSQKIIEDLGLVERIGDSMEFMGTHPPRMLGMSTLLSEVYRSAYIRTLQHFFDIDLIQIDMFHKYALATMPVELSIWNIKPNRAPEWWPKLQHETAKESYDNKIVGFAFPFDEVEQIINERQEFKILGINGTIEPKNGWTEGVLDTAIQLAGFAYRTIGPNTPDAKMLAQELFYRTFIFSVPRIVKRPFSILECSDKFLLSQEKPNEIDDLLIYPIVAPIRIFPINLWQWFRGYHPFMVLFKPVSDSNILSIENDRLCYYREGKLIARSLDWTQGIKERSDLEIPHGTYIEADAEYLNNYLENIGFKLGYVIKISHKFRKYTTDKEQIIEDYRLINVSKIII